MAETSSTTLRHRLIAFLVAGAGGMTAAAVSFAMSVYDAAHPPQVEKAAIGEVIDTGRWHLTILGARTGMVSPTGIKPSQPRPLLMVDLDVENRAADPTSVLSNVLKPQVGAIELPMPMIYLDKDKWFAGELNPGMPERVTAVWEWPQGVPVPEKLTLDVMSQVFKQRDNLYGATGWYDRDAIATVDLPVARAE